ncbi:hypothetical protein LTR66_015609 [Elasticomyces elasticus]|nr:hypothetical protein LTR66_015609 [Elasticomyces elasticus]
MSFNGYRNSANETPVPTSSALFPSLDGGYDDTGNLDGYVPYEPWAFNPLFQPTMSNQQAQFMFPTDSQGQFANHQPQNNSFSRDVQFQDNSLDQNNSFARTQQNEDNSFNHNVQNQNYQFSRNQQNPYLRPASHGFPVQSNVMFTQPGSYILQPQHNNSMLAAQNNNYVFGTHDLQGYSFNVQPPTLPSTRNASSLARIAATAVDQADNDSSKRNSRKFQVNNVSMFSNDPSKDIIHDQDNSFQLPDDGRITPLLNDRKRARPSTDNCGLVIPTHAATMRRQTMAAAFTEDEAEDMVSDGDNEPVIAPSSKRETSLSALKSSSDIMARAGPPLSGRRSPIRDGRGRRLPKDFADMDKIDYQLWTMRNAGKTWAEVKAWCVGEKYPAPGTSTLSVRYMKLKKILVDEHEAATVSHTLPLSFVNLVTSAQAPHAYSFTVRVKLSRQETILEQACLAFSLCGDTSDERHRSFSDFNNQRFQKGLVAAVDAALKLSSKSFEAY